MATFMVHREGIYCYCPLYDGERHWCAATTYNTHRKRCHQNGLRFPEEEEHGALERILQARADGAQLDLPRCRPRPLPPKRSALRHPPSSPSSSGLPRNSVSPAPDTNSEEVPPPRRRKRAFPEAAVSSLRPIYDTDNEDGHEISDNEDGNEISDSEDGNEISDSEEFQPPRIDRGAEDDYVEQNIIEQFSQFQLDEVYPSSNEESEDDLREDDIEELDEQTKAYIKGHTLANLISIQGKIHIHAM